VDLQARLGKDQYLGFHRHIELVEQTWKNAMLIATIKHDLAAG
jgi:hypothetical protein